MIRRYVKSEILEAIEIEDTIESREEIIKWSNGVIEMKTLTGQVGDFVVKGIKGDFFVCENKYFRENYFCFLVKDKNGNYI